MAGMPTVPVEDNDSMSPEQASQIVELYGGGDSQNPEPIDDEGANLAPLAAAKGDAPAGEEPNDVSASGGLPSAGGALDVNNMYSANPRVRAADAKLDNIISQMTARQEALIAQHQQNGATMPLLAFASGMLSPTRTGGFGESLGTGMKEALPAIQQERAQDRMDQQGLFSLRLKAATLEQERARMEAQRQYQYMMAQRQRADKYAQMGMRIDDNGNPVLDKDLLNAATAKEREINAAREGQRFNDEKQLADVRAQAHVRALTTAMGGQMGSPLTPDELGKYGLPPGTVAVHDLRGPRVISKPSTQVMVGTDDKGQPIYADKNAMVSPATKTGIEGELKQAEPLIKHYNWLIDQLESGKIGDDAFGPAGKGEVVASVVGGHFSDHPLYPETVNFRTQMNMAMEPTKHLLARDATGRISNAEAEDVEKFLPNTGFFSSKEDALVKLKAIREKLIDKAHTGASMLGPQDIYSPKIDEWAKTVPDKPNYTPGPLFGPKGSATAQSAPKAATPHQSVHEEMPDASQFPNKILTDTTTGKKFKSDGKEWKPL